MTETPHQERPNAEPGPNGLNTENLRDFRQLRRSTADRKIAGVAGGLARHLDIDPVIVRVVLVVLCFFGGSGFILYGAAWLLVPQDTGRPAILRTSEGTRNALLVIAAVFAGLLLVGDSWGGFGFPWPLAVLALVVFAVLMSRDSAASGGAPPGAPSPYSAHQPGAAYGDGDQTFQPVTGGPPLRPRKSGPLLFGITLALVAAGLGALGLYDAAAEHNVADAAYPALALGVVGAMLVVGSFFGRAGGLILLGIVSAVALAGTSITGPRYEGQRDVHEMPELAAAVHDSYHVPAGRIELDLRGVRDPAELDGRQVDLSANAGEILVILPPGLAADVDADVAIAGAVTLPRGEDGGLGIHRDAVVGAAGDPRIDLDLDLKLGHIEVRQAP